MEATKVLHKKNTLAPKLRFKEFTGEWVDIRLKDLTNLITKGTTPQSFSSEGINYVKIEGLVGIRINKEKCLYISEESHNKELRRSILQNNDLLFAIAGATIGKVAIVTEDILPANTNQALAIIRLKNIKNLKYVLQILQSRIMKKYIKDSISVGAQPNLNLEQMGDFRFHLPSLPEQRKIASFLSAVDEKIQQLSRKKELLEEYKKGVMQQLFSGKLRFKDDEGQAFPKWEEKRLGDVAERVARKNKENNLNVLTISAQQGLISQLEYFNKSVSAKNVTNYYLLHKGDFAYNKSYSIGYPMGAIKRLIRYEKGVVSTLYICFRFNENVSFSFMEQYFENGYHNAEIEKVAQEGARNHGLLNIGLNDFFNISLTLPSKQEQESILNYLSSIDKKIESINKQITKTQTFKKGLLQQMFV